MGLLRSDYTSLNLPLNMWDSVASFISDSSKSDAVHVIKLPSGRRLEVAVRGMTTWEGSRLPIFFSGALPGRKGTIPPYFSGARLAGRLGLPWVAISDPLLASDPEISLSWYTGAIGDATQARIAEIVACLAGPREPLCIGGSGGGFAALVTTSLIPGRASALVWNPQTDVRAYAPFAVAKYFAVLGIDATGDDLGTTSIPDGIHWTIPRLDSDKSVLYLQNSDDWHVSAHASRFVTSNELTKVRIGVSQRDNLVMLLARWGEGHAVPPGWLTDAAIGAMGARGVAPMEAVVELEDLGALDSSTPFNTPTPLAEGQRAGSAFHANLTYEGHDTVLRISRTDGAPTTDMVVYAMSGRTADGHKVATGRQRKPNIRFVDTRVVSAFVVVRDGFDRTIDSFTVTPTGRAEGGDVHRSGPGVFLYGSCVSRDAFAHAGAPPFVDYVARSPLGSAFAPPAEDSPAYELNPSTFQRRMVEIDWNKKLQALLANSPAATVLVDLIDERISLAPLGNTFVANSPEVARMGFAPPKVIPFGSPAHFERFQQGWHDLVSLVGPSKLVVSKAMWAETTETGEPAGDRAHIRAMNSTLRRYYREMERSAVSWISYPSEVMVAASQHRWGVSPFHYIDAFYEHTISSLKSLMNDEYVVAAKG